MLDSLEVRLLIQLTERHYIILVVQLVPVFDGARRAELEDASSGAYLLIFLLFLYDTVKCDVLHGRREDAGTRRHRTSPESRSIGGHGRCSARRRCK